MDGSREEGVVIEMGKKEPRTEVIYGLERLFLKNYSDTIFVVAKKGNEERKICKLDEYEKGLVVVQHENGKRAMLTLQSVSR